MKSLRCVFLTILVSHAASATVWYVDKDNASGTGDGTSWATAFTAPQPAIDAASDDTTFDAGTLQAEVWVAEAGDEPALEGEGEDQGEGESSYIDVSIEDAHALWDGGIFALDVRTTAEFDSGHIPGATNIDVAELASRLSEITHLQEDDILVYCRSGGRSAVASQQLADAGFTGIHNMLGGFSAWVPAGYEVATGAEGEVEREGEGEAAEGLGEGASEGEGGAEGEEDGEPEGEGSDGGGGSGCTAMPGQSSQRRAMKGDFCIWP